MSNQISNILIDIFSFYLFFQFLIFKKVLTYDIFEVIEVGKVIL